MGAAGLLLWSSTYLLNRDICLRTLLLLPSMKAALSLLFILPSLCFGVENFTTGYRVLHTSPQEVVSALTSPAPVKVPRQASETGRGRGTSRMQKYFRVRRKTIEGQSVVLEVAPELPLLGTEFADANIITLKFTEIARTESKFTYSLKISTQPDNYIDTTMIIEPNISGSLLTLRLNNPSLLSRTFSQAALSLGFLERTPQAAEAKDH